jgi:poly-gamma-glutamate synthesis protein (capsule biosynthesis protein)
MSNQGAGAAQGQPDPSRLLTLFLCGDVMTGRGIDQVLPHPCDPELHEPAMTSALEYVALAELANGPIPKPVGFSELWGDALGELEHRRPDIRIINLETSVTRSPHFLPKGINYRMSPENFPCIAAAGIDCCVLANNHVLDFGPQGLVDTLDTLKDAGIGVAGAGCDTAKAATPAILPVASGGRVVVLAFGAKSSGIPGNWAATAEGPGINLLPDLSPKTVQAIGAEVRRVRRAGDIVVVSIHWGANWGYRISRRETAFAHALVDLAGVDIVHGHSSHHPKAIEVYRGRPILYGCGDFLNDYEGVGGYGEFRDDLVLMYLVTMDAKPGALARLTMVPFQIRNFRLGRAQPTDAKWICEVLEREGKRFGTRVHLADDDTLSLAWD